MVESELYQTEKVFKELFENINSGVAIYETVDNGENFIVKEMNKAGLAICKVSRETLIGKNLSAVFPNIDEYGFIDALRRVWKTGKAETFPRAFYKDERVYGWTEVYIYKLPSEKVVTIFESQTELIEAEKNFKKKVEFEKTISTVSSQFVNPDDLDEAINSSLKEIGKLSQASRSYLFLFNPDNITMSNTHEWCADDVSPQIEDLQNLPMDIFPWSTNKLKEGEILNIENVENLPPEASAEKDEFLRENIKSLIFLPLKIGEKIAGFIGFDNVWKSEKWSDEDLNLLKISSDIIGNALKRIRTERELEELNKELRNIVEERTRKLQESESEKSTILESLLEHIIYQTVDNTIIYANKAAADSVNLTPEQLIGRKCYQIWNTREEPCDDCPVIISIKTNKPTSNEMTTPDGRIWYVAGYPIRDKDNNIIGVVESTLDITEKKTAEQKIKKSEEKYRKAYYQANLYRDIFAHDINNILQNISSSVELSSLYLHNPEKLSTIKELYEIVNEQVNRAKKLITNVRKITELDETEIILEKMDAVHILNSAIEFLQSSFQTRNIDIQVNTITEKTYINANSLILDVFENILINAVRHNNKSEIKIIINIREEEKEDQKFLRMEFQDNGIGISDYRKKSIFERGSRKSLKSKGMGLGLSLVKIIIDLYHGDIWVEDRVEGDYKQGSNFVVLIPSDS
ncbi:MAG: ATP-binding protein [Promethearchaeota archaeon]